MTENTPNKNHTAIEPLRDEEVKRGLEALERAGELRELMLKRRGGKPVASSWKLIREEREKRSKRL